MIAKNFTIDFINKKITYNHNGGKRVYEIKELYAFLQNLFAQHQSMKHKVPIYSKSKDKYYLVNGWKIDSEAKKHLNGGSLAVVDIDTE